MLEGFHLSKTDSLFVCVTLSGPSGDGGGPKLFIKY